jgi:hypothetical protein
MHQSLFAVVQRETKNLDQHVRSLEIIAIKLDEADRNSEHRAKGCGFYSGTFNSPVLAVINTFRLANCCD